MKKDKITTLLTTIVCLLPIVVGILLYSRLPEQLPTHWNASGEINGYMSKPMALFLLPGSLCAVNLLMPLLLKADPKYKNMSSELVALVRWIIPAVSIFCSAATIGVGLGHEINVSQMISIPLGIMFIFIGNYLPKTKQSYTMGIKLPWTLASEENWNRTHRLGGFLWVIGGILMIIGGLIDCFAPFMIISMIIMILVPAIYSYSLYKKGI